MRDELIFQAPKAFAQTIELIPIKPLRHGTRSHQLVVMQSKKNGISLRMRPLLVDFCVELERRRDVLFYQTGPYRLKHSSRKIQYTPSVCAYCADTGLVFYDVVRFSDPACEQRRERLSKWFDDMGYPLYSYTVNESSSEGPLRQYRNLYHQSFGSQPEGVRAVLLMLQNTGVMSITEMLTSGVAFCDIAQALFSGQATTDLRFPLRVSAAVQLASPHHAC